MQLLAVRNNHTTDMYTLHFVLSLTVAQSCLSWHNINMIHNSFSLNFQFYGHMSVFKLNTFSIKDKHKMYKI